MSSPLHILGQHIFDPNGPFGLQTGFFSDVVLNLIGFVLSALLLSFLLPRFSAWYEYRRQAHSRRIMASSIANMHFHIVGYADRLKQRLLLRLPAASTEAHKRSIIEALRRLQDVPQQFPLLLKDDINNRYFQYRLLATNAAAFLAKAGDDYDGFDSVLLKQVVTYPPDLHALNAAYASLMQALGSDIWRIDEQQPFVPPWKDRDMARMSLTIDLFIALEKMRSTQLPGGTYGFIGVEASLARYRPRWPQSFAIKSLAAAGIRRRMTGDWTGIGGHVRPHVVSIGAGAGADAAAFKALGCDVTLIDPNPELLRHAQYLLQDIPGGSADYRVGTSLDTGLKPHCADLIVVAHALHAMTDAHTGHFGGANDASTGRAEAARRHWRDLLIRPNRPTLAIWFYNPDPDAVMIPSLHRLLNDIAPSYRGSITPLYNAEAFRPATAYEWISPADLHVTDLMPLSDVLLTDENLHDWYRSYSFAPKDAALQRRHAGILRDQWFSRFSTDGELRLGYRGYIMQGRIRRHPAGTMPASLANRRSPLDRA